jgi:hypothetical protein
MIGEMAGRGLYARQIVRGSGFIAALLSGVLVGTVAIWVDPEGNTILTNREEPPVPGAVPVEIEDRSRSWRGEPSPGPETRERDSSLPEDRLAREVRVALEDLDRGETKDALSVLRRLHREQPGRPDVALALADVEQSRGRFEAAESVLEELLTTPAKLRDPWESRVRRALSEVRQEIEAAHLAGQRDVRSEVKSANFRLTYDHRLAGRAYGDRVIRILEEVRAELARSLGRTLSGPLDVKLYTRSQYLDAHRGRFPFATVGFYDGAIHLVTARHPRTELLALLTHEYVHALFREALGADQPFFLNEGIAEREETAVRGRSGLVRGEWWKLVDASRSGEWIPLRQLVPGFGGLEGPRALLAYLESRAAVQLLEDQHPGAIANWLSRCARGDPWEVALVEESGWSVATLDRALRREVAARFPDDPLGITLETQREPQAPRERRAQ